MYGKVVRKGCLARCAIAAMAGLAFAATPSSAQDVRIGELNSYSRMAAFAVPYRNGMQLAQDEINAKGGVMGGARWTSCSATTAARRATRCASPRSC